VWDLTHDGATTIPGAAVDSGSAGARVPVAPGEYTVRLTLGNQKPTQKVQVKADPRWLATADKPVIPIASDHEWKPLDPQDKDFTELQRLLAKLEPLKFTIAPDELTSQQALAIRVRDDISKLSDTVVRIRAVKKQIDLRKELLKDRNDAKALLKQTEALEKKLDDLEGKFHNSKAKISYDIFAAKGGAMLYSQLAWLLTSLTEADGAPTQAQKELADELSKELKGLVTHFDGITKDDIGKLNAAAKKLGVPELYVPLAKK
jgi:predicted nuclease with TOPRIM domain